MVVLLAIKDSGKLGIALYVSTTYSMPHGAYLLMTGVVYTTYAANWLVMVTACSITSTVQSEKGHSMQQHQHSAV